MNIRRDELMRGTWLYDGHPDLQGDVRITRQNWDSYLVHEDEPFPPPLMEDGWVYYVEWAAPSRRGYFYSQSRTCQSVEEAKQLAEDTIKTSISWAVHETPIAIDKPLWEE